MCGAALLLFVFFCLVLDDFHALLTTFSIGGAHDIGLVRLHGAHLTTIEGEELATNNGALTIDH